MTDVSLDREALVLFEALLEAEPEDPNAWLAARALGRPELEARVQALAAASRTPTLNTGGARPFFEETKSPERLGAYSIGERIGSGGMGSVFLARRDRGDFDHVVAVKIIKPGLLSQRLVERFLGERQTLAQLRHPNIAQLFDGGETEDGAPYIVMEYIEGRPLLTWAEETRASRAERIDKLLQACAAVSFAHANLVVHRDITPSNVLVTAGGVVKLIDFGIARPAAPASAPAAANGEASSIGNLSLTPGYAAPERLTGAEPTTAVDIYSLGRVAERLLDAFLDDHELKAIVSKAIATAPQDRYGTADQLAADLAAWRDRRPVSAFAGGGGYALAKFAARHRAAVFASAAALALLLAALAATGVAWRRAESAREAEAQRFEDVRALATYLLFDLNDQLRGVPGNTAARADLAAEAQAYLDVLSNTPGADRALRLETALGLIRLAEIQDSPLDRNLGLTEAARENLARARAMIAALAVEYGDATELAVAEARVEAIASLIAFYEDTDADESLVLLERGKAALERVPPSERRMEWRLAQRALSRAEMERHTANEEFDALVAAADRHDALVNAWPEAEQGEAAAIEHAYAAYNRGLAWSLLGREAEGYPVMRAAHDAFAAAEARDPNNAALLYMIGWSGADAYSAAANLDKAVEAEDLLASAQRASRRLVEIEDRDQSAKVLGVMVGEAYAQHLGNTGRFAEAIAEQRRIVEGKIADIDETSSGADAAWSEMILGVIAKQAGDRELVCTSWASAEQRFSNAEAADRLVAFHAAFLPGLRANLERCRAGDPLADFPPLR